MLRKILIFPIQIAHFLLMLLGYILFYPFACIALGIFALGEKAWNFLKDLWRQASDPGYHRLNYGGYLFRQNLLKEARKACEKGNWQHAVNCWLDAACYFSPEAMAHLGECYEQGNGVDRDLAIAHFWYAKAVQYHGGPECQAKCDNLQPFAMSRKARKVFCKDLKNFWKNRACCK